jgi:hypothetical protein
MKFDFFVTSVPELNVDMNLAVHIINLHRVTKNCYIIWQYDHCENLKSV